METKDESDHHDNCPALPEIKVIIIGSKTEYKSNAANTILGHNDYNIRKEIVKSEMKQRMNKNRSVTVVPTPGWWKSFTLIESTKYIQMEIVHSLKLCPAPQAFLLVVNLHSPFTDTHLNSVVEHMEILGEQIWKHTIVLLVYDNKEQRDINTEQILERAGTELDILIKKCGNRVHVFNYTDSKGINVEKLFNKIENLAREHEGDYFKIDRKLLDDMEKKRTTLKKLVEERDSEVKTKKQTLKQCLKEKTCHFPELRIILMGSRIVGKTSVMNTILNIEQGVSKTKECVMTKREVDKREVTIIDTPGWWPYASVKETPDLIQQKIMSSVSMCPPGAHAVLLVLQSGVAFTEAHRRSIKEHMELLGKNVWKYSIVVFTRGDWMGTPTVEEHIESEGEALKWLIIKCGNRYHVLNNIQKDDRKQVRQLMEKVEMMACVNTMLPITLEDTKDMDEEGACTCKTEQVERKSLIGERPQLHMVEDFIERCNKDLDYVSDYGTMEELLDIEQFEEERTQKSKTITSHILKTK